MKTGFVHLHNLTAWLLLIVLIVSVVLFALGKKKELSKLQNKLILFAVILSGVQLLVGLSVFFLKDWYQRFGEMSVSESRFYLVEHPMMMIIAIALIHIGNGKIKKAAVDKKNKKGLIFFGISLLLVLSRMPWSNLF